MKFGISKTVDGWLIDGQGEASCWEGSVSYIIAGINNKYNKYKYCDVQNPKWLINLCVQCYMWLKKARLSMWDSDSLNVIMLLVRKA